MCTFEYISHRYWTLESQAFLCLLCLDYHLLIHISYIKKIFFITFYSVSVLYSIISLSASVYYYLLPSFTGCLSLSKEYHCVILHRGHQY